MHKKQRLHLILFFLAAFGASAALALYGLRDNITFFYTPHDVKVKNIPPSQVFRLGGMVKKGSVQPRKADTTLEFIVTDFTDELMVTYQGLLPDLFREGQGVVATGHLDDQGHFIATQLLAKHDEKYMPPDLARSLKK